MKVIYCGQIHSDKVVVVDDTEKRKIILNCDGLITSCKDIKLYIKTADCLPITIRSTKVVAVVHVGWRGLRKNIVSKAIELIKKEFNIDPTDLKIKIGPSKNNYLVRSDVYNIFKTKYSKFFEKVSKDQWKMDLRGINVHQLISSGVYLKNIKVSKVSTFKNKKYPSFRRDGKTKGFVTNVMLK